jgi:peptide/nickel transport system substrate-binding protein
MRQSFATRPQTSASAEPRPRDGGTVTWACTPGFPPVFIFPFTDAGHFGIRNLFEFQALMYRPLYWCGKHGRPEVDFDLSLAGPPRWSSDGLTATVTVKPFRWSNGEVVDADSVMLWMHLFEVNKAAHGGYVPGYFPDNLTSYRAVAGDQVAFTFDRPYSREWVLMNQLSLITPMPKAWDRTADGPADATHDKRDAGAVYAYLMACNEDKEHFATSPIWSVVNGPWRLKSYGRREGAVFVPNEHYSGPVKPRLAEFRQIPTESDDAEYALLQAGPRGPGSVQIGFLPFDRVEEPTTDPRTGGPNPLAPDYRLIPQVLYSIHYFPLNLNNPTAAGRIFRQLYFRQALQSVLDQDGAIRDVYKGYGYRTTGPIPLLPPSDLLSPRRREEPYPFSVERARALLTDNGWDLSTTPGRCVRPGPGRGNCGEGVGLGDELSFTMRYAEGHPTLTRVMERFRDDAARAGIEIRLSEVDGDTLVAEDTTCTPGPASPCLWQMSDWNGGWVYGPGFYPTGEFLFKTGAGVNFGSYSDAATDALIDATVTRDDLGALHAYQDHVAEQVPVIWMPNFPLRLLEIASDLKGVEPLNPFGLITPENWYYE